MIKTLLVANRGEIAVRIMKTAREMGIRCVAVYSEADKGAPHTLAADLALPIGAADPASSYLNIENILAAARQSEADAIHPGYGFLSENPAFARAVVEAGLIFVGPTAEVMQQLGDKITASQLATDAGLPTIPGYRPKDENDAQLLEQARRIGFPVLVKASAGGGGKGMRVVEDETSLSDAVATARSEAQSAFGDGRIFLEKYFPKARHVEIQIMADNHGNALHLFERECSIQRRHQKIIEESPCPVLSEGIREQMGDAALALVRRVGYSNAGTVEFLMDDCGRFYFLEVNTRLQVEHPVTEMITGLDLVRMQLDIANGKPLSVKQKDLTRHGHAIECRIYAEDPEQNFMPSPGELLFTKAPTGPGVRFDSGIATGQSVSVHYDPILAKLIAWAPNRAAAIARLIEALKQTVVLGVTTPVEFLIDVLDSEAFRKGDTFTRFLDEHFSGWTPSDADDWLAEVGYALAHEFGTTGTTTGGETANAAFVTPWQRLGKWSL